MVGYGYRIGDALNQWSSSILKHGVCTHSLLRDKGLTDAEASAQQKCAHAIVPEWSVFESYKARSNALPGVGSLFYTSLEASIIFMMLWVASDCILIIVELSGGG